MAWSSAVPAALSALLAAFRAAPALSGTDIRDGPVVTGSPSLEAVLVGWYGQPSDDLAVDGTTAMEGLGGAPDREQFAIRCAVMVMDGQNDMTAARARAYVLAAVCGAVVAADRKLAGTVMRAYAGSLSLRQEQRPDGAVATVGFTVECDAYTSR